MLILSLASTLYNRPFTSYSASAVSINCIIFSYGGISDKIARNIVRKASSIADDEIINQILDDLLHLGIRVKYNRRSPRLDYRAGHES